MDASIHIDYKLKEINTVIFYNVYLNQQIFKLINDQNKLIWVRFSTEPQNQLMCKKLL